MLGVVALVLPATAASANVVPYDPGTYCRITVGAPSATGFGPDRAGYTYTFGVQVHASLSCNGPAYSSYIWTQINWKTYDAGVGQTTSGIRQGATHSCSGSCDAWAYYNRSGLWCGDAYTYTDYGYAFAVYQQYSNSTPVQLSSNGPTSVGSSGGNPPGSGC
jgi:hypothetical protein